jgi:hypothetical protein
MLWLVLLCDVELVQHSLSDQGVKRFGRNLDPDCCVVDKGGYTCGLCNSSRRLDRRW